MANIRIISACATVGNPFYMKLVGMVRGAREPYKVTSKMVG